MKLISIAATAFGLVLALGACGKKVVVKTPPPMPPPSLVAIEDAYQAFSIGDYPRAVARYEEYLQLAPTGEQRAAALLNLGIIYAQPDFAQRDRTKSSNYLNQLVAEYPGSPLSRTALPLLELQSALAREVTGTQERDRIIQQLNAELKNLNQPALRAFRDATTAWAVQDYATTVHRLEEYLRLAPLGDQRDVALFNLGIIHGFPDYPQRSWEKFSSHLKQLVTQHPDSPLRQSAQMLLAQREEITQNSGEVEKREQQIRKLLAELDRLRNIDSQRRNRR